MIKLELTHPIYSLNGEIVIDTNAKESGKPFTTGSLLSNFLSVSTDGNKIKFFEWAKSFYKNEPVEVDKSDYKTIYDFVLNNKSINSFAAGQIIENMEICEIKSK